MSVAGATLAVLLALAPGEQEARAELEVCAKRIEELKVRQRVGESTGRELERLLIRAQELAAQLDRAAAELPPVPRAPSPEELRERADAARDEADRISAEIALLDVKIGDLRRIVRSESDEAMAQAALGRGSRSSRAVARLQELLALRQALVEQRAMAEATAEGLEAEARRAEADH